MLCPWLEIFNGKISISIVSIFKISMLFTIIEEIESMNVNNKITVRTDSIGLIDER